MKSIVLLAFQFCRSLSKTRKSLVLDNLMLRQQIRRIQKENPIWSAQRIQVELVKLGFSVCDNTVDEYMCKPKTDPDKLQRWLTFLRNHAKYTVGIDFFVVRTIFFKAIYVFVAISHDRRRILHFAVSSQPHSQWAFQQFRETFAFDETTKYVIRDNDKIFSEDFNRQIRHFGLKDTPTAPRSPWQNPICERVIGTFRRGCLDHMIILNEKHLHDVLHEYILEYYNVSRTHMSLEKDSPIHRPIQKDGRIVSKPILGGLHHIYSMPMLVELMKASNRRYIEFISAIDDHSGSIKDLNKISRPVKDQQRSYRGIQYV